MRSGFLAFWLFGLLVACDAAPASEPPPADAPAPLVMEIEGVEVRDYVGERPWGDEAVAGAEIVLVRFRVTNEGRETAYVGSDGLWLVAPDGDAYASDVMLRGSYVSEPASGVSVAPSYQLGPGLSVRDVAAYELPEGRFDAETWTLAPTDSDQRFSLSRPAS